MNLAVFLPVAAGQSATCRVTGDNEPGYVKIKLNGSYATVLPDEYPGVSDDRRVVFCPTLGCGYDVWTQPIWQAGATLVLELYDSTDQLRAHVQTMVI